MQKTIKLLISSALALIIVLSFNGTAYAETLKSDQSDLVSIEEYEDAMSQIYAEYGIGWEITDSSNCVPITRALFDSEIKRAYEECEEHQAQLNESASTNFYTMQSSTLNYSINSLMPVRKYISAFYTITGVYYMCEFRALADITYDADSGNIMTIHSKDISYSTAVNLDNWVDSGSSITLSGTTWYANFIGTAYFSYTTPEINVKISKSIPFNAGRPMS